MRKLLFLLSVGLVVTACDSHDDAAPVSGELSGLSGTGSFVYDDYAPLSDKPVTVFYHVPEQATTGSPVLFTFTGANRDARESRDAMIAKSNQLGFILLVPEFSDTHYPGSSGYNLGNVFVNGNTPSSSGLNPENEWTFSLIDPMFDYFKERSGSQQTSYDIFGHSAGSQFVHRFLLFKPNARYNRAVAASAGWYTMPDETVGFPYGLKDSPAEDQDLTYFFALELTVVVGEADNDPNASGLRHTSGADAQGLNRLDRANYFYSQSYLLAQQKGMSFNWVYRTLPQVDHDFSATSTAAANLLYL